MNNIRLCEKLFEKCLIFLSRTMIEKVIYHFECFQHKQFIEADLFAPTEKGWVWRQTNLRVGKFIMTIHHINSQRASLLILISKYFRNDTFRCYYLPSLQLSREKFFWLWWNFNNFSEPRKYVNSSIFLLDSFLRKNQ